MDHMDTAETLVDELLDDALTAEIEPVLLAPPGTDDVGAADLFAFDECVLSKRSGPASPLKRRTAAHSGPRGLCSQRVSPTAVVLEA